MIKKAEPTDVEYENIGNALGVLLCGGFVGTLFGLAGLGLGFIILDGYRPLGMGLVSGVIGFLVGVKGGFSQITKDAKARSNRDSYNHRN